MIRKTVLIADDDSQRISSLAARCAGLGLAVSIAGDPLEARQMLSQSPPAIACIHAQLVDDFRDDLWQWWSREQAMAAVDLVVMTPRIDPDLLAKCGSLRPYFLITSPQTSDDFAALLEKLIDPSGCRIDRSRLPASRWRDVSQPVVPSWAEPDAAPRRPTVLCIDDDAEISKIIKLRLEAYGVDVVRAFNGMQGFWTGLSTRPDVIITDLVMPDGDGNYILGRFKTHPLTQDVPVIVLSGQSNPALRRQILSLGGAAFLDKPLVFKQLLDVLRSHLALPDKAAPGPVALLLLGGSDQ